MVKKKVSKKVVNKNSQNPKNTISIVLGALSVIFSFVLPYFVVITGVLGIVFAYVEKGNVSKKLNLWAFVLNLVGLALAIVFLTFALVALITVGPSALNLGGGF